MHFEHRVVFDISPSLAQRLDELFKLLQTDARPLAAALKRLEGHRAALVAAVNEAKGSLTKENGNGE